MTSANRVVGAETPLFVRREPPLGWMVVNRPHVRNALDLRTWHLIAARAAELEGDPDLRVIVLRGAAAEAFISGADISEFERLRANAEQARIYRETTVRAVQALVNCAKPVVAMIAGACIGGGVQVALACDVRIAARDARFGVPAARLGLSYPPEAVAALVRMVGPANARDILLSARLFDANEAARMGLVNRVVEPAELETEVREYCLSLAGNAPLTLAAVKAAIGDTLKDPAERDPKRVAEMAARCFDSEDYREGRTAFSEKRAPRFRGR